MREKNEKIAESSLKSAGNSLMTDPWNSPRPEAPPEGFSTPVRAKRARSSSKKAARRDSEPGPEERGDDGVSGGAEPGAGGDMAVWDFGEMNEDAGDLIMSLKTGQTFQFKTLLDVLKDLLTEVNLEFAPDCIKLVALDPGKVGMVHLVIEKAKLDYYRCDEPMVAGILLQYLYKTVRAMNSSDFMAWEIRRSDPDHLYVTVFNSGKRSKTEHRLKLLDLEVDDVFIPKLTFDSVISMPSNDLSKHIREMASISDKRITVRMTNNTLELEAEGDMGRSKTVIEPTASGLNWVDRKAGQTEPIEGTFFVRYLDRFVRNQVNSNVQLFMKQDKPLILRFDLSIGTIRFCISPIVDDADLGDD